MPSLAPTAAGLDAQLAPPRISPYEEVHVLIITWRDRSYEMHVECARAKSFFQNFGCKTTIIWADDADTQAAKDPRGHVGPLSSERDCGVVKAFEEWVYEHDEEREEKHRQRKKLLIICYIGHGDIVEVDFLGGDGGNVELLFGG